MEQQKKPQIPSERIRPFNNLTSLLSSAFMDEVERLLFLVTEYGASKVEVRPSNPEQYRRFMEAVHEGWKQAQGRIAELLTSCLERRAAALERKKRCRVAKDKEGENAANAEEGLIGIEIVILRRTLDVALWTILRSEQSTLRRLYVKGGNHSLSAESIAAAMPTAEDINARPHAMALCTDMLSLVHVGDLLVIDLEAAGRLEFVELKAGDKNFAISKAAEFAVDSGCRKFDQLATAGFNPVDVKHFERAKRQTKRNKVILDAIRNEGGQDHNTGGTVRIHATGEDREIWSDSIMRCYRQLSDDQTYAITTVDGCIHVGVYSDRKIAFAGFNVWMDRIKCESPIYNLTDSFAIPSARPLGSTMLSPELQKRVLRGEIIVIICLNLAAMAEVGNRLQPGFVDFASEAQTRKFRAQRLGTLELKGRAVRLQARRQTTVLATGFRDRVVFDQQRPTQLLRHQLRSILEASGENSGNS